MLVLLTSSVYFIPGKWVGMLTGTQVVAAQAFHWSNDGVAAIKEIARVLKPGGKVHRIRNSTEDY